MRMMTVFAVAGCAALSLSTAQAAQPISWSYDIVRNGDVIGHHQINFQENPGDLKVNIATDVAVKVLFVTAYKFHHKSQETWQNGHLMALASKTDDDGTDKSVAAKFNSKGFTINGSANTQVLPNPPIPASLWNRQALEQPQLMNTLDGSLMSIQVNNLGKEDVTVGGHPVKADHYQLQGQLERDLWFDQWNRLVRMEFNGQDGSRISYRLQ